MMVSRSNKIFRFSFFLNTVRWSVDKNLWYFLLYHLLSSSPPRPRMAPSDKMKRDENTTNERHGEHKEEFSSDTPNGLYSSTGSAMRPAGAPVTNQILPLRTGILGQVPPYGFGASMMGGPSYFEMAVLNQRFAMEEQARMRLMAHAAAIADQRAKLSRVLPAEVLRAQERL